jgi:hypothetical protein
MPILDNDALEALRSNIAARGFLGPRLRWLGNGWAMVGQ